MPSVMIWPVISGRLSGIPLVHSTTSMPASLSIDTTVKMGGQISGSPPTMNTRLIAEVPAVARNAVTSARLTSLRDRCESCPRPVAGLLWCSSMVPK